MHTANKQLSVFSCFFWCLTHMSKSSYIALISLLDVNKVCSFQKPFHHSTSPRVLSYPGSSHSTGMCVNGSLKIQQNEKKSIYTTTGTQTGYHSVSALFSSWSQ